MDVGWLCQRLTEVEARIEHARARGGRKDAVHLVAVTKGHPIDVVRAAHAAGLKRCGENRVAELEAKVDQVPRGEIEWHLIGHLQRNKIKRALPLFDLIHSIDSHRLAQALSQEAESTGVVVRGLIQVNVSGETTKGGFAATASTDAVVQQIAQVVALPGLEIQGLMTLAPFTTDESVLRAAFGRARALFERCAREVVGFQARHLSMGMTNDFEIAVEEGSTMLRLGTILFGERPS